MALRFGIYETESTCRSPVPPPGSGLTAERVLDWTQEGWVACSAPCAMWILVYGVCMDICMYLSLSA